MAGNIIPSKQLHRAGTLVELQALLSIREIGLCTDDDVVYIKNIEGELVPIGVGYTAGTGISIDAESGVISLTERSRYVPQGDNPVLGPLSIEQSAKGNNGVKVGNVSSDIGLLAPVVGENDIGSLLQVGPNGGLRWVPYSALDVTGNFGDFDKSSLPTNRYIVVGDGVVTIRLDISRMSSFPQQFQGYRGISLELWPNRAENDWMSNGEAITMTGHGIASEDIQTSNPVDAHVCLNSVRWDDGVVHNIPLVFYAEAPDTFNVDFRVSIQFTVNDVTYCAIFEGSIRHVGATSDRPETFNGRADLRRISTGS